MEANLAGRKRIVLTTFGSLGDLHPYIAVAKELGRRGHEPVIATSGSYRNRVEGLGIGFAAVRPDMPDMSSMPEIMRRILDRRQGSKAVIRDFVMPPIRDTFADTLAAARGADLLVSHMLTVSTRLVAEKLSLPWASTMLQPLGFFSAYDPPVMPVASRLWQQRWMGRRTFEALFFVARKYVRSWSGPWRALRKDLGLPRVDDDPLFEGQHSPSLVLALFSRHYADKQPDWPTQSVLTGFPFFDEESLGMAAELKAFLDAGSAPIVFTLGSSAVMDAGSFYRESAEAARMLGKRAVLLVGSDQANRLSRLPAGIAAFDYAPYAELFPRAAAIVHPGGIGTTAQALRAGKPMLVMPYAHDQPDNAARLERMGVARSISRGRYRASRAAVLLESLLADSGSGRNVEALGASIRAEDGAVSACDALEALLT